MKRFGKKGEVSTLTKAILTILVLLVCILIFRKVVNGSTKVIECTARGGDCVKDTCSIDQIPMLANTAAGCKKGELCCINITSPETSDPECTGKEEGEYLEGKTCKNSTLYVCGPSGQCMTKCSYCALNFGSVTGAEICKKDFDAFQTNALKNTNHPFKCDCSNTECTQEMKDEGKCLSGYCPGKSTDATGLCCAK